MILRFKTKFPVKKKNSFHKLGSINNTRCISFYKNPNINKYNVLIKQNHKKYLIRWFSTQDNGSILSKKEKKNDVDDIDKKGREVLDELRGFIYRVTTFRFITDSIILSPYIMYRFIYNSIGTILFILDEITDRIRVLYKSKSLKEVLSNKDSESIRVRLATFVNRVREQPYILITVLFRYFIILPIKYIIKLTKYISIFVLYSVFSPLLLLRGIKNSISKIMKKIIGKREESDLIWKSFAPISWQLYAEGEKIGLLSSKITPLYKQIHRRRKLARDRLFRRKTIEDNKKESF